MVLIVGGGGAGLRFGTLFKEKNPDSKIIILEEHKDIGKPVQCTGILTDEIEKLVPRKELEKFTLNKITKTKVISPNNSATIPIKTNYIISNPGFIEYLHESALKKGVDIKTGTRYLRNTGSKIEYRDINSGKIIEVSDDKLVGADGPASKVARNNNLFGKRDFLTGVQARVRLKDFDASQIDFYPHIGEYAWFTPESDEIARIGVAAKDNAKKIFDSFIKKYPGTILEMQGGPIPLHKPGIRLRFQEKKFSATLLGDSALQIKNTTGGGIIPGLKAAKVLSDNFESYEKKLGKLNRELYIHYLINKTFRKYSDKDWDRLIEKIKNERIKRILEDTNRDNSAKLAVKLSMRPLMLSEGARAIFKLFSP